MSLKKLPFISSVQLARIDDSQVIPTALFYEGKKAHVGRDARDKCTSPELLIEDFKIELGNNDPDRLVSRSTLSNAARRTPAGLAKDFFEEALRKINGWLASQGLAVPTRILIAEPLSLGGSELAAEHGSPITGNRSRRPFTASLRRSISCRSPSRYFSITAMDFGTQV
ncbi:hypothetical protein [Mesorhizobium sp.]|uniref:hypothetical protein n=1 Tax=Mesorhizobium sp. TaxID=1871066 RepID=UPI002580BF93|nr:hypothetical protein [Mesorhizobium sp.]